MKIEGHHRKWDAQDEDTLERVLELRDDVGGALFWLTHDGDGYPALTIRISGDMADVHYFPGEGHPGFRALAESPARNGQASIFVYDGCDPMAGEETPSEFVLHASTAMNLAKDFYRNRTRSSFVSWFEL